jgi:hypothetical protein
VTELQFSMYYNNFIFVHTTVLKHSTQHAKFQARFRLMSLSSGHCPTSFFNTTPLQYNSIHQHPVLKQKQPASQNYAVVGVHMRADPSRPYLSTLADPLALRVVAING